MQSVTNFINSLGGNYYKHYIINSNTEVIDFDKYNLKVYYNNEYYYELDINEIHLKRREIINNIRDLYENAISENICKLVYTGYRSLRVFFEI